MLNSSPSLSGGNASSSDAAAYQAWLDVAANSRTPLPNESLLGEHDINWCAQWIQSHDDLPLQQRLVECVTSYVRPEYQEQLLTAAKLQEPSDSKTQRDFE